jgi:hypothetical protein
VVTAPSTLTLNLPLNAWQSLGAVLTTRELGRSAQVCKSWKASIASYVRVVTLSSQDGAKVKQLRAIAPNVESLIFLDSETFMSYGEGFALLPRLKKLKLVCSEKTLGGSVEFCLVSPHFPVGLKELSVPMAKFTRGSLVALEKLTNLTDLDLSFGDWRADDWNWTPLVDSPHHDDWVVHLPPQLVTLNLAHCHVLSDRMLKKFKRFRKLKKLNVENCFQLTDVGISALPASIEELNMAQCIGVFRKGDARQGVLPANLSWLRLSFNFNDHFVGYIPNTLTSFLLEKSYVTDAGME